MPKSVTMPFQDRFWAKVKKTKTCWLWTAAKNPEGYGRFKLNGKLVSPHRLSYELEHGPIPDGHDICHKCDNPSCVNPSHLFAGTRSENMLDAVGKERLAPPTPLKNQAPANAVFDEHQVRRIRGLYKQGYTQPELADRFGVARNTIQRLVTRKTWSWVN